MPHRNPATRPLAILLLSLLPALLATPTHAAAVRWANAAGGNWNVAANWSPATIPTAADTAVIDLNGTYTVTINQNVSIAGLRVSGSTLGTQTLTAASRTLTFTGPVSFGAQAIVTLTSCTVNGAGAITNDGSFSMTAGSIAQALANNGTFIAISAVTQNGAVTTGAGSTLRVLGNASFNSSLAVANGFTNNGTIELTSTGAATAATLTVTAGTLVNAAAGQINALAGSGGARTLTAAFDNQGTITVSQALATNKASAVFTNSGTIDVTGGDYTITLSGAGTSFTTGGTINVAASRTLNLNGNATLGTGLNYVYNGGTFGGAGTVSVALATLVLNAPISTSVTRLTTSNATVSGASTMTVPAGVTTVMTSSALSAPTTTDPGGKLQFVASDLTGTLTNNGTWENISACTAPGGILANVGGTLRVLGNASFNSTLTVTNGFTNNGTIELTSSGAATSAILNVTNGTLINGGGGTILSLPGGGGVRQLNAKIDNQGQFTVSQALSTNKASVAHTNSGTLDVTGGDYTVTLSGTGAVWATNGTVNVAAGRTLNLNGNVTLGTNLNYVYNGGTFGGAGTISFSLSSLVLNAPINTAFTRVTTNNATILGASMMTVPAGATTVMTSSALSAPTTTDLGGKLQFVASDLNGTLTNNGTWENISACTAPGVVLANAGGTIRVLGNASFNSSLVVTNGFTNNGTIELTSVAAATSAVLNVTNGVLTNAPGGTIVSLPGNGGARQLNARIDNQGQFTVSQGLSTNKASVAHTNSGTLDVTGGDYTVTLSGSGASFTTGGTINVAASRTLNLNGNVTLGTGLNYVYDGGTFGGAGTVSVALATLVLNAPISTSFTRLTTSNATVSGASTMTVPAGATTVMTSSALAAPTHTEPGGILQFVASDLNGTLTNDGTWENISACTAPGGILANAGGTLRVLGNPSFNSTLTVTNGFTNNGTIELTSTGAATSAILNVTNGTLINGGGGTILSLPGGGGARQINAKIDNQGQFTVSQALSTNKASVAHTNSGTLDVTGGDYTVTLSGTGAVWATNGSVNVAAGRTLNLNGNVTLGTNLNYVYNGGTFGGAGTISFSLSSLVLNAPINTAFTRVTTNNATILGASMMTVPAGATTVMTSSALSAPTTTDLGGKLQFVASDLNGTLTNNGTWENISACTAPGVVLANAGGTIRVLGNPSFNSTLTVTNGFTNNGTIELTSTGAATSAVLNVTNGTLTNATGATITSLAGAGGARQLNAQIANQGTVTVAQNLSTSKASVTSTNSGTVNLTGGNWTITLSGAGSTFTTTGTMSVGTGRTLALNGNVSGGAGLTYHVNGGSLGGPGTVSFSNATLSLGVPLHTASTNLAGLSSTVSGADTLHVDGANPTFSNCDVNVPVVCSAGSCDLTNSNTYTYFAVLGGGQAQWFGVCQSNGILDLRPNGAMRVMGNASVNTTLTSANPILNGGTFELGSTGAATSAVVSINGAFTNASTGTLLVTQTVGGARQLLCGLVNQGLADVQQTLLVSRAAFAHSNSGTFKISANKVVTVTGASFTNTATGTLAGNGTLTMSGATTFAQSGTVSPGASAGKLTFTAATFPCAPTSVYHAEVGGDVAATGYDQFAASGPATLAGTLEIATINGFLPTPGRRYVIATFPSRTGTFSAVTGLDYGPGQMWTVAYSDTDVVLLAMDQTWTKLFPFGTPPVARDGHAAVLDEANDRMIVFGGRSDAGVRNDVWVLTHATSGNGSQWLPLAPAGTPPVARTNASAVYDAAANRLIVHGGDDAVGSPPTVFGDTWVLTNANGLGGAPAWIALAPASAPPARSAHGAAYDPATNRMMLVGGDTTPGACGGSLADAWVLENANGLGGAPVWTALAPTGTAPSAREFHAVAWDSASSRLVLTGGQDGCGNANTEAFVLDGANGVSGPAVWTPLSPASLAPAGWALARYAYDPTNQWFDAFGGTFGGAYVDTSWTLTGAAGGGGESWHRRVFWGTRPTPRALHSLVESDANHVAVVFGGSGATGRLNDVYRREIDKGRVLDVTPPPAPPVTRPRTTAFALPPSPNPAHGDVALAVDVARDQRVDLDVFDLAGRRVSALHSGVLAAGRHAFTWRGAGAAPGVYLVRLHAEDREQVVRVVRVH